MIAPTPPPHAQVYKCTLCNESFSSKKGMERHIRNHDDVDLKSSLESVSTAAAQRGEEEEEVTIVDQKPLVAALPPATLLSPTVSFPTFVPVPSPDVFLPPSRAGSSSADSGFGGSGQDERDEDVISEGGLAAEQEAGSSSRCETTNATVVGPPAPPAAAAAAAPRLPGVQRTPIACIPISKLKEQFHSIPADAPRPDAHLRDWHVAGGAYPRQVEEAPAHPEEEEDPPRAVGWGTEPWQLRRQDETDAFKLSRRSLTQATRLHDIALKLERADQQGQRGRERTPSSAAGSSPELLCNMINACLESVEEEEEERQREREQSGAVLKGRLSGPTQAPLPLRKRKVMFE